MRAIRLIASSAAVCLATVACSQEERGGSATGPAPDGAGGATTVGPQIVVDPAPIAAVALADGEVTDGEMRATLVAAVGCVRAAGLEASLDEFKPRGGGWTITTGSLQAEQALAVCSARFVAPLESLYVEQNGPTDAEIQRHDAATIQCLQDMGYGLPDEATLAEAFRMAGSSAFIACDEASWEGIR